LRLSPLTLGILILTLIALINVALHWWLRRKARQEAAAAAAGPPERARIRDWISRGLRAVAPPLALLLWVHGIAVAVYLPLLAMPQVGRLPVILAAAVWLYRVAMLVSLAWLLARVGRVVERALAEVSRRAETKWDDVILPLVGKAVRRALPLLAIMLGAPALAVSPALAQIVRYGISIAIILVIASLLVEIVNVGAALMLRTYRLDVGDNLQARAVHTQVMVLKKVAISAIVIFTVASILMVFESVRQFGASILASAGIAGIIIGFAAQRSISTLLAGFQIAVTQPIRVDDVVIVEGEWGRIEEITLTYVVVRIWDLRRLVVPIGYFIEKPFQNWTRTSSNLLATAFVYVDYGMPVDAIRTELTRVLEASKYWDRKVNVVHVTEARERTIQIRALASAADASQAFELQCEMREALLRFVRTEHANCLPRDRAVVELRDGAPPQSVPALAG
jgi:small-conductance mechanosensitive channel